MPRFRYEARDSGGKMIQGILDAGTDTAVATQLIRQGLSPLTIELQKEGKPYEENFLSQFKLGRPKNEDLAFLCRQMYSLTRSGVPIVRSLRVVADSSKNEFLKLALADVIIRVEEGLALAVAMRRHPKIFPNLMIALLNVGENTGSLDVVFQQLAVHFEREMSTRMRIKAAIRYPLIVLLSIIIAMVIINIIVIPAFAKFFQQFHAELPLPTRILIAISDFMVNYWYILFGSIALIIISIMSYVNTKKGRYNWDKWKLKFPVFGSITLRTLLGRFCRTFALCFRTGVPLLDSIDLMAKAIDNTYMEDKITTMKTDIEHGSTLTVSAINTKLFSALVLQMLAIGEETGEVDRLLDEMAQHYEEEVDYDVKRLSDLIEPIILVILGVMVLVLALGVYLPMWDLARAVLKK